MPPTRPVFVALAALAVAGGVSSPRGAAAGDVPAAPETTLTVYSSADPAGFDPEEALAQSRQGGGEWEPSVPGFGVVKEVRTLDLAAGTSDASLTDVARWIDPTSVSFADLDRAAGTSVLEQSFRFDLASPDKVLERYVDRTIAVEAMKDGRPVSRVEGTVLSVNRGTVVLKTADGLRYVSARDPGLRLPALPEGLVTKPTLVWKVVADAPGTRRVRTSYRTAGITWRADYGVVLAPDAKRADFSAWVSLVNLSGATYRNARLKLVAGDVRTVEAAVENLPEEPSKAESEEDAYLGFEEKSFFEYHLYTLPRKVDVLEASTQQIPLFPTATGVPVEKWLVFDGFPEAAEWGTFPEPMLDRDLRGDSNPKVDVYLRWKNEKAAGLGVPFPKGRVRVYQRDDADGTLEFVGEDLIDHTPKDETILVKTGQAFDLVGDRTQTRFVLDSRRRTLTEAYRIRLRNHRDAPARVTVQEHLFRWAGWSIESSSDPFSKVDARTVRFEVDVPGNGERSVTYVVHYRW